MLILLNLPIRIQHRIYSRIKFNFKKVRTRFDRPFREEVPIFQDEFDTFNNIVEAFDFNTDISNPVGNDVDMEQQAEETVVQLFTV